VFEELENLREEIYKERCKLSDANREKNKYLREQSRTETIVEEMQYVIENMKPFNYHKCDYHYGTNLEASLLLSDLHYGLTVDNTVNFYDESVCEDRLNQLRDKTVERCKAHKVDKLNVCILGDDISGLIHFSTIAENNRDVITQCIEVSELLSNFVMQLREEIPEVKVYTTYGNHSRTWQGKANGSNKENYERIVAEFLKTRLKPYGIKVVDGGWEDFIVTEIAGKKIVMTHGDKDSLTQASANFAKLLGERVDEIYMAHLHAHREFDDCNTQIIINGSLVSTDDYALSLRKHTNAVQLLRIYGEDVCCYRLKLD
jgi:predicted phosphodiesterase